MRSSNLYIFLGPIWTLSMMVYMCYFVNEVQYYHVLFGMGGVFLAGLAVKTRGEILLMQTVEKWRKEAGLK
jgi:hypothetical protein